MQRTGAILLFLVLALFAAPVSTHAAAQLPQGPTPTTGCKECGGTGRTPCPKHPKNEAAHEDEVEFCSFVADCEVCGGAGWVNCKKCGGTEDSRNKLQTKRDLVARRKPDLAKIDQTMGRSVHKAETAHVKLVWEVESMKVEKKVLDAHALLHLYASRLERMTADYRKLLDASEGEFRDKNMVFVWALPSDHDKASLAFCEMSVEGGVRLLGVHPRYSVCASKKFFNTDEQLHRNLVHNLTHLLLSHQQPTYWIGNIKAGWADEGLAHWFEYRYFTRCDTYCFQEQNMNTDYLGGDYRVQTRKLVAADKAPPAAAVFDKNTDSLKNEEHLAVYSYVDFLMARDGAKFGDLCRDLRRKMPSRDALQKHFSLSVTQFEAEWKTWVLATYPQMKE